MSDDLRTLKARIAACETYEQVRAIFLERLRLGWNRDAWPAEKSLLNARGAELLPEYQGRTERQEEWAKYRRD